MLIRKFLEFLSSYLIGQLLRTNRKKVSMPKIAILNMIIGFSAIFVSACGGFFLGTEVADTFIHEPENVGSWFLTLASSAHGHTNLFGYLHILVGLTMPYSFLKSSRLQIFQTACIGSGTFAMSFLMFYRSLGEPESSYSVLGILIGICLSLSLVGIFQQIYGLSAKLLRRY